MAKITDFKFDIQGEQFKVNVNCTSGGNFTARLPEKVAEALSINKDLSFSTLSELEKHFNRAIDRYKKAQTSQELFIFIRYKACGRFDEKNDRKGVLFGNGSPYHLSITFGGVSAIAFDYKVMIMETVDNTKNWYDAKLGSDFPHWDKEESENPDKYYKQQKCNDYGVSEWKKIPFSKEALKTLQDGSESLRKMSEMLFNFVEQDEKVIEQKLTNHKLLS